MKRTSSSKVMYRLKLTLKNGKVFLGPFVYDLDEKARKKKLKKMSWLCKNEQGKEIHKLEFIEVNKYPKGSIHNSDAYYWRVFKYLREHVEILEDEWNKLTKGEEENGYNRKNFEEMEERSVSNKVSI